MTPARYAIYWTPAADSALGAFARAWFGWCAERGESVPRPALDGLPAAVETLTATPARYGVHGTLKAPFHLADGADDAALAAAFDVFCDGRPAFVAPHLELSDRHGFVSLRPSGPSSALDELAGAAVETFDAFRAPPSEAELAKRRRAPLTRGQDANLVRWGYPYVFESFAFHITLTGPLSSEDAGRVQAALRGPLATVLRAPFQVRDVSLMGDPGGGAHFRLLRRRPLSG